MAETVQDTQRVAARSEGTPIAVADAASLADDHARRWRPPGRVGTAGLLSALDPLTKKFRLIRKRWSGEAGTADLGSDENAVEWFLDNHFLLEETIENVREALPGHYYRELPVLKGGSPPLPRVYELATGYLSAEQYHVTVEGIASFLDAYQERSPLSLGEVWALPSMLRLALMQLLGWAAGSLAGIDDAAPSWLAEAAGTGRHDWSPGFRGDLVARAVAGLRALDALDWAPTAERISIVHRILVAGDPSGVYSRMDFASRDRYRRAVEEIARRSPHNEPEVARTAVDLATAASAASASPGDETAGEHDQRHRHVGYYLIDAGRRELETSLGTRPGAGERLRRLLSGHATGTYLGAVGVVTAAVVAIAAWQARSAAWAIIVASLLVLVPALTAAVALANWAATRIMPPRVLAKLDFSDGIPADQRCLVVVPALISRPDDIDDLLRQIQEHHARNPDPALTFAVLSDFTDSPNETMPEDAALLAHAEEALERLNRYTPGAPFLFLNRRRLWNPSQGVWMGWERKRGKLHELNKVLLGEPNTSYNFIGGDQSRLTGVRYVITLDADTVLPPDGAYLLIGALAHPLNRPLADPATGRIVAGYTVLQPRAEIDSESAGRSPYTRIFAGEATVDLYSRAVSDAYQDLFGAGIYVGKGIYDVRAFEHSVAGRIPENAVLSHDLLEGIHGRVGLATDVTVYEEYPPNYLVGLLRSHRWVRGDWQLLPWLAPRTPREDGSGPNDLALIDRWKIGDNLRRSLLAPAVVALLLASWLGLPGSPLVWTALALLTPLAQVVSSLAALAVSMLAALRGREGRDVWRPRLSALQMVTARWLIFAASLGIEAALALDAIARTLWRSFVSRRNLLEWTTAAGATRLVGKDVTPRAAARMALPSMVATLAIGGIVAALNPPGLPWAAPFLVLWLAAPWLVSWVSRPFAPRVRPVLTPAQVRTFGALARRTWLFFEQHVGPEDNWLPPDNFQEHPLGVVAHRTSPTNIGLYLTTVLAAHDRGYLGTPALMSRLSMAFDSLDKVERHRGHLPNWIDTTTLQPLRPSYVSTVDSGNLAACLVVTAQGCEEALGQKVQGRLPWRGFLDAIHLVREGLVGIRTDAAETLDRYLDELGARAAAIADAEETPDADAHRLLSDVRDRLPQLLPGLIAGSDRIELEVLNSIRLHISVLERHLHAIERDADTFTPWVSALRRPPGGLEATGEALSTTWTELTAAAATEPTWRQLPEHCESLAGLVGRWADALPPDETGEEARSARRWASDLEGAVTRAGRLARDVRAGLAGAAARAREQVAGLELSFLYDRARGLFHIGYNLDTGTLDGSYYDLLASESRLTSLLAIALHQVPKAHWLHLARPMTRPTVHGPAALLSWSGTMFEYLLPFLLVETPPASLLGRTCAAVVEHQIAFGRTHRVPWGVSESGYYAFDSHLLYQYRAFGVPSLALQRRIGDDVVIAPYASLLATPLAPDAVEANLSRLRELGAIGPLGAYEAVDFTRSRVPLGSDAAIVRSHMAHHQGMIMLALAQALDGPRMVERLHAEPFTASMSLLLREEPPLIPREPPVTAEEPPPGPAPVPHHPATPWTTPQDADRPGLHWLSNGSYHVLVTDSGGGASRFGGTALTRWRADPSLEEWGTWLYLQDLDSGELWSAARRPWGAEGAGPCVFHPARAEFRAEHGGIRTDVQVTVAPDDNVEIRRVELVNESDRPRTIAVTGFAEVVLTDAASDLRHPAFGKLFVEAEALPDELTGLSFRRRPRAGETPTTVAFSLVKAPFEEESGAAEWGEIRRTADRRAFLGRQRSASAPVALDADGWWTRPEPHVGRAPLDPAAAIGQVVTLAPHARARLALVTCAADGPDEALDLVRRFHSWAHVMHTFGAAATRADHELRDLGFQAEDLSHAQRLLSLVTFPDPRLAVAASAPTPALPALWGLGISGDLPLICARLSGVDDLPLVEALLRAHRYWRRRDVHVDIALVDEEASGYSEGLRRPIQRMVQRWEAELSLNVRGGIFILNRDQIGEPALAALQSAAQVVFDAGGGDLGQRLDHLPDCPAALPFLSPPGLLEPDTTPEPEPVGTPSGLRFDNGSGAFTADGREYLIRTGPRQAATPSPWVNVIATEQAGFLCSESGLGATWVGNSGENRLTPWRNDPLTDMPSEVVYVRDEETGEVWTPTPLPAGADVPYLTSHGAGYTEYEHISHRLTQRLRVFAVPDEATKAIRLEIRNAGARPRRLTVTYYAEWVLGAYREGNSHRLLTGFDPATGALLAENPFHPDRPEATAFLACDRPVHGWTADRTEFLGRPGNLVRPPGLTRSGLARAADAKLDPCAALQLHIDLPVGGVEEVCFFLGQGATRDDALATVERVRGTTAAAWEAGLSRWDDLLGAVQIQTPDPALDLMVNRWVPYQTVACRMWGRTAAYQSSGAYGFRDQLQDSLALLWLQPSLARAHLLRAAAHQFTTGDVLHWWHEPNRGVRTRISDDMLWLPYAVARYIDSTGDVTVLDEQVSFLAGEPLAPGEDERYDTWTSTTETADLLEHCQRAVERGMRLGAHGLPLMGTGDWNDGMNRIGAAGRGESVWLAWFAHAALQDLAGLCERRGEEARRYRAQADELVAAVERHGWDGEWYLRAFDDEARPIGSARNDECQIDSIAQSWAVLSGAPRSERTSKAVASAVQRLVDHDNRLILLFTPPFDGGASDPGYIKGYLPGVRENGGQYTHASIWLAWATAELGDGTTAAALLDLINPIRRTGTREEVERYLVEPYALAADVYAGEHPGRGGWTWYTGSAAWFYRCALEGILGMRWQGDQLVVEPNLPTEWDGFTATVQRDGVSARVTVRRQPDGRLDVQVDYESDPSPGNGG